MDEKDFVRFSVCWLFRGVDPVALRKTLKEHPLPCRSWEEGSIIAHSGSVYAELLVILEGEARAEMTNDEGKTFAVESLKPGEAVATAILFSPERRLPVTIVASRRTRVAMLRRESLVLLCVTHPPVLESLLSDMGQRLAFLADKLRSTHFATLRQRLADWILRRSELSDSPVIRLESTKERLSELFGVARPSLSRELGTMEAMGILKVEGRTIHILDRGALRQITSVSATGKF